jgi:VanZ family protein
VFLAGRNRRTLSARERQVQRLSMAGVARAPPLRWPLLRVVFAALALALLTEGLQRFASNRDPSWHDVGIDMAGAVTGMLVIGVSRFCLRPGAPGPGCGVAKL